MHCHQKTIKQRLQLRGTGLHTGKKIDVVLSPMPKNSGLWFQRTDSVGAKPILASAENVTDTSLATTIGHNQESISTLEHLLAALGGLGINNLKIEVSGPELPILDGSALPWVDLLKSTGCQTLNALRAYYRVKKSHTMALGDKFLSVEPSENFSIDATIDFPGFLKLQSHRFVFSESAFTTEISPARTFCLLKDVKQMQEHGKALGGGLDNAVVLDTSGILNPEGLRFPDECVRHKILDFLGDITLAQAPIIGHFTAFKTGHTLNRHFLSELLQTPGLLELVTPSEKRETLTSEDVFSFKLPSVNKVKELSPFEPFAHLVGNI